MYKWCTVETAKSHCIDKDYQTSKHMLASSTELMAGGYEYSLQTACENSKTGHQRGRQCVFEVNESLAKIKTHHSYR